MDRIIDSVQDKNSKGIKNRKVMNVSGKYLDKIKYNDQPSMPDKDSNVISAKDHMHCGRIL